MSMPRHLMILASAGSGKTYELTNRFVALLAAGARPERIVALTFTRKAAGEFFDEILGKLAEAARDPGAAARLAAAIAQPRLGPEDFLRMLRTVIEAMSRLRLGTLDGFFARIARSFPLELGLAGEFELLQEHAAQQERRAVLQRIFRGGRDGEGKPREFIEAFKRATFGREEKQLGARLDEFLDSHHEVYLAAPDAELWGNAARIWVHGNPWLEGRSGPEAAEPLRQLFARRGLPEKQQARWDAFFAGLTGMGAGPLPKAVEYILKHALAIWPDLGGEGAGIHLDRKRQELSAEEGRALRALSGWIVRAELGRRLETTQGIHAVLAAYDRLYQEVVRRTGRLTFADVQRLVLPEAGARRLTGDATAGDGRIFIDYRLDAGIDHWLLDEFQDTSFGQWSVLRSLIDEAVQDPSGERSFFCVGDVKQSIFAWREGDPRLFGEIFDHYTAAAPGAIAEKRLDHSHRSGPSVIAMVNAVFGGAAALADFFPGEAGSRWNEGWRTHETAVPDRRGQAAWLVAPDEDAAWEQTLRIITEIDPQARGLSCAVLVQTNETAARLADFLRRRGALPAVAESDLRVGSDNPAGAALLSLFQAAAHPGDTWAWEHLRMTPLGKMLTEAGVGNPDALSRQILGEVHAGGFEAAVAGWSRALEASLRPDDGFTRQRLRQFAGAARWFDGTGSREVAEFVTFVKQYTVREAESATMIRVMTIHKAKGLGFDVVLLPDLDGTKLEQRRRGLAVQRRSDRSVEWVLDLPGEVIRAHDPVLAGYVRAAEAEAAHEALSLLYVAMTRAKRAMYVIAPRPGKSTSRNYPGLLARTLGETASAVRIGRQTFEAGWADGDPDWPMVLSAPQPPAPQPEALRLPCKKGLTPGLRRVALRPSDRPRSRMDLARLFSLNGNLARKQGSALHALLAEVEWCDRDEVAEWETCWKARGVAEAVIELAVACLRSPVLAGVFQRPDGPAAAWREQAFEVVLDGKWVSGVFDRVVVEQDEENGRARRAVVFDFKTDRLGDADDLRDLAEHYDRQLNLYRTVVAKLTGLGERDVRSELVLTRTLQRIDVARSE